MFRLVQNGIWTEVPIESSEWVWGLIENFCITYTTDSGWLMLIATFYIFGIGFALYRWMPRHFTMGIMFYFTSLSFWTYSNNGIRQGMAASLMMAALAVMPVITRRMWPMIISLLLMLLSIGTHNSLTATAAVALFAYFFPSKKRALYFWIICLLISPFSTKLFINIGDLLIQDRRVLYYGLDEASEEVFNRVGWRWDFIIYSSLPVILGWYVFFKRKSKDHLYLFLYSIYTYSNALWLIVNSVAYSNRFAYISWYLYPVVLCYPLAKMYTFRNQGIWAGFLMIFYMILTLII